MVKKTMAMALAGLMLTSMAGTTALTAKAENDDVMELTMYFPVSVGGGPDALIDALCEEYHRHSQSASLLAHERSRFAICQWELFAKEQLPLT